MNQFLRYALLLVILIAPPLPVLSQTLKFFDLDKGQFPILKAKFYAFDAANILVSPALQDLTLSEDDKIIPIMSVKCSPETESPALSSVIMVDISGSMSELQSTVTRLDLAKTAANAWVNALPKGLSEASICSFNTQNYINQDFTTNRQTLLSSLTTLRPIGGTDYNKGLLEPFAGALQISKNAKYQKVIIYITDGLPNFEPKVADIITEARNQQCMIFAITLDLPCPKSLIQITEKTGGQYFENVTTEDEAQTLYLQILKSSQLAEPCEIVWKTDPACESKYKTAVLEWNKLSKKLIYEVDASKVSRIEFTPSGLLFDSPAPVGQAHDTTITIKAFLNDFTVKNITSSDSSFDIFPKQFKLLVGESKKLTIRYTPKDSSYYWSEFSFETDICPQSYFAAGRFNGVDPSSQTRKIQLSYPNGEEVLVAGSDNTIRWNGIPATDNVLLELSDDNAKTWKSIARDATELTIPWRVPTTIGTQFRVRVSQSLENNASMSKDTVRCIGHTNCVRKVAWSPDESKLLTVGSDGDAIIWDAIGGKLLNRLSFDSAKITHAVWSPDGSKIALGGSLDSVLIWDVQLGKQVDVLLLYSGAVTTMSWNFDNSKLLICNQDGTFIIWKVNVGTFNRYSILVTGNRVNYAAWSPDGNYIALCTEDIDSLILWDTGTTQEKLRINNHSDKILHVAWSPDGRKVATSSKDKLIKIGDIVTGNVVSTLVGHTDVVTETAWSPGGKYIASSSDDMTCCIWNPVVGSRIEELKGHTGSITHLEWRPDGKQIATSSKDKTARIWGILNGETDEVLEHSGEVTSLAWNKIGTRIATSSCDLKTNIWYIPPVFIPYQMDMSDTVFSIVAPTPNAQDVDMGQVSVGNSKDTVITEYLRNTGTYPYRVDSIQLVAGVHSSEFTVIAQQYPFVIPVGGVRFGEFLFHPTSKGLKTAEIHIFTQAEVLTKTISGIGTVDSIEIQGVPLGFGKVDVGTEKDIQRGYVLTNHGTTPVKVLITEIGPNEADYAIIDNKTNITLNPGDTVPIDVRFAPKVIGRTGGGLNFDFGGKRASATMQLFGEGVPNSPLLALTYSVNMGNCNIGETKDSSAVVMVQNKSTAVVRIDSVEIIGTNPEEFSIVNNTARTINPLEKVKINIRFTPKNKGNKYAELVFNPQNGGSLIAVTVMGKGVEKRDNSAPATATLRVGSMSAQSGDTIQLPLIITKSTNLQQSQIVGITGRLHFKSSLLSPIGATPSANSVNGVSTIGFSFPVIHSKDTQIIYPFLAKASPDSTTILSVDSIQSVGGKVLISVENGQFRLLPVSKDTSTSGGKTNILFEQIQLGPLAPNPTGNSADLTLSIIEKGTTLLQLVDVTGRTIKTFMNSQVAAGLYSVHLNFQDVAIGKYFLLLQTPTQKRTLQIEIKR